MMMSKLTNICITCRASKKQEKTHVDVSVTDVKSRTTLWSDGPHLIRILYFQFYMFC